MAAFEPKTGNESLMYSTVRIAATFPDGRVSYGTGFYFTFKRMRPDGKGQDWNPMIISNKHVLWGCKKVEFFVHLGKLAEDGNHPIGKSAYVTTENHGALVFPHPNPDVDLCGISAGQLTQEMREGGLTLYAQYLTQDDLPTEEELREMDTVEDVLMVGYPNKLWDSKNNFPLFRRGITSTHPSIDHDGKSETVVDMACFPGSSGSPVVWDNDERLRLLGVLSSGPMITAEGEIEIRNIPTTAQVPVTVTPMMMHLGYIVKAKEVAALGRAFFEFFDNNPIPPVASEVVVPAARPSNPPAPQRPPHGTPYRNPKKKRRSK